MSLASWICLSKVKNTLECPALDQGLNEKMQLVLWSDDTSPNPDHLRQWSVDTEPASDVTFK